MNAYSRLRRDLVFGVCAFCFAIFFGVSCVYTINTEGETGITGQTFPFIITAILLVLSCLLLVGTIRKLRTIPQEERIYTPCVSNQEFSRILQFLVALVLYVLGFMYLGFIVSTAAFLAWMLYFMHASNLKIAAGIVGIAPLLLWYFFTRLMEVSFPEALLL